MALFFALCLIGLPAAALLYDFYNEDKMTAHLQKLSTKMTRNPDVTPQG